MLVCIIGVSFADQRNLGMSMRVERSTLDQVKQRFEVNKKKLEEKKKDYDFEQRMQELREEVERPRPIIPLFRCLFVDCSGLRYEWLLKLSM